MEACFDLEDGSVPPEWIASAYDEPKDPEDVETIIVFAPRRQA